MSSPDSSDSPQVKFIHEWGQGFENRDLGQIEKHLHKDYRHTTLPRSLGQPEETREQWLEHFGRVLGFMTGSETTVHSIIDTPGKVIVHLSTKVKTVVGVEAIRESIFIDHIVTDEDGSLKIKHVEEFTDSKAHLDFVQAVVAATVKKE